MRLVRVLTVPLEGMVVFTTLILISHTTVQWVSPRPLVTVGSGFTLIYLMTTRSMVKQKGNCFVPCSKGVGGLNTKHAKTSLMPYGNSEWLDQSAHLHSLLRAFFCSSTYSTISYDSVSGQRTT